MEYYAQIGSSIGIAADVPPGPNYIVMEGPNRTGGVAEPDGTWSAGDGRTPPTEEQHSL